MGILLSEREFDARVVTRRKPLLCPSCFLLEDTIINSLKPWIKRRWDADKIRGEYLCVLGPNIGR